MGGRYQANADNVVFAQRRKLAKHHRTNYVRFAHDAGLLRR